MPKMTNAQTDAMLETIAKRIEERKEVTPKEAADIVRESKTAYAIQKEPSKK